MGYACIWEFYVIPERQADFERIYGPEGKWTELFRRARGYVGTLLLKDRSRSTRYVTVDRWRSELDCEAFRVRFSREYEALDAACRDLTVHEMSLGAYDEGLDEETSVGDETL
jgi:heme-degrading monooxygenase HmoA